MLPGGNGHEKQEVKSQLKYRMLCISFGSVRGWRALCKGNKVIRDRKKCHNNTMYDS